MTRLFRYLIAALCTAAFLPATAAVHRAAIRKRKSRVMGAFGLWREWRAACRRVPESARFSIDMP